MYPYDMRLAKFFSFYLRVAMSVLVAYVWHRGFHAMAIGSGVFLILDDINGVRDRMYTLAARKP